MQEWEPEIEFQLEKENRAIEIQENIENVPKKTKIPSQKKGQKSFSSEMIV